jgi:GNAT superfamily N-acetyltransferase
MIERTPNTNKFKERREEIAEMLREGFAGFPWYEHLSIDESLRRVNEYALKQGFESFLAEDPNGKIVGGLWYDTPSVDQLEIERGKPLADFAQQLCNQHEIEDLVWERELIVRPDYQGQRVGTRLRETFISYVSKQYPEGVIILTRMREDNPGTIIIAERLDYQQTGIRVPSSQKAGVFHEYWYKLIPRKAEPKP